MSKGSLLTDQPSTIFSGDKFCFQRLPSFHRKKNTMGLKHSILQPPDIWCPFPPKMFTKLIYLCQLQGSEINACLD